MLLGRLSAHLAHARHRHGAGSQDTDATRLPQEQEFSLCFSAVGVCLSEGAKCSLRESVKYGFTLEGKIADTVNSFVCFYFC